MESEISPIEKKGREVNVQVRNSSDAVYGIGLIGAWVFFISRATTPQEKAIGFLKGLVWPAFLVHALFEFLHKE